MIVVSLVLPTSALDLISSVYAQVSQTSNVEMQNFDALNALLETSTSQQENTDEIEEREKENGTKEKHINKNRNRSASGVCMLYLMGKCNSGD